MPTITLTPSTRAKIIEALQAGRSTSQAATYAGVSCSSVRNVAAKAGIKINQGGKWKGNQHTQSLVKPRDLTEVERRVRGAMYNARWWL